MTEKAYVAYCMTCKKKNPMANAKVVTKEGRSRVVGNCEKCNQKMSLFIKSK